MYLLTYYIEIFRCVVKTHIHTIQKNNLTYYAYSLQSASLLKLSPLLLFFKLLNSFHNTHTKCNMFVSVVVVSLLFCVIFVFATNGRVSANGKHTNTRK